MSRNQSILEVMEEVMEVDMEEARAGKSSTLKSYFYQ
jgi:hypothetical protein